MLFSINRDFSDRVRKTAGLPAVPYTLNQGRRALIEQKGLSLAEILGLAAD